MKSIKNTAIILLPFIIISLSNCSDIASVINGVEALNKINPSPSDKKEGITNSQNKDLDVTKVVEIQVLNPSNKSSVEW